MSPRSRALAVALAVVALAGVVSLSSGTELALRAIVLVASATIAIAVRAAETASPGATHIAAEESRIALERSRRREPERDDETTETAVGRRHREAYIAAVSHELRTPLNAILGFTDVLLSEIDGPLSASQREDVTAIHDSGSHLRALVEEVIGESAGTSAAREIKPVPLEQLVRELGRGLEAQLRGRPITLRLLVEEGLPSPVGDARRVRQILWNLGGNAVRYTERGEITLRAKREGDVVRISVTDTGRGIAKEDLGRIFAAGERVDPQGERAARARPKEGWGLGLAIAQEMAEFHGGHLEVESELGKGSTFHFVIPVLGLHA